MKKSNAFRRFFRSYWGFASSSKNTGAVNFTLQILKGTFLFACLVAAIVMFKKLPIPYIDKLAPTTDSSSLATNPPKYRIYSIALSGDAIGYLLQGQFDAILQKDIGKRSMVLKNNVYQHLHQAFESHIASSPSQEESPNTVCRIWNHEKGIECSHYRSYEKLPRLPRLPIAGVPIIGVGFEPSEKTAVVRNAAETWPIVPVYSHDIGLASATAQSQYFIETLKSGKVDISSLEFRKSLTGKEAWKYLADTDYPWIELYRVLTGGELPPAFLEVTLETHACAGDWDRNVYLPLLNVSVTVVEPLESNTPLKISDIESTKCTGNKLVKELVTPTRCKQEIQNLDRVIRPDEILVIPTTIYFQTQQHSRSKPLDMWNLHNHFPPGVDYDKIVPVPTDDYCSPDEECTIGAIIPIPSIGSMLRRIDASYRENLETERYFSPISSIPKSITINGRKSSVRVPVEKSLHVIITDTSDTGSCPYLLVRENPEAPWREIGNLLTGFDEPSKSGTYTVPLKGPVTSILLQERESEVTHLQSLDMLEICGDSQTVISPVSQNLPAVLGMGDSLVIHFAGFTENSECEYYVQGVGFYETHNSMPK